MKVVKELVKKEQAKKQYQPSTVSYNSCRSLAGKILFQKNAAPSTTAAAASLFNILLSFLLLSGDGTNEEGPEDANTANGFGGLFRAKQRMDFGVADKQQMLEIVDEKKATRRTRWGRIGTLHNDKSSKSPTTPILNVPQIRAPGKQGRKVTQIVIVTRDRLHF